MIKNNFEGIVIIFEFFWYEIINWKKIIVSYLLL